MLKQEDVKSSVEGYHAGEKVTLKAVFDSSPDAITIIDLKGNIVECNQATLELLGCLSLDEVIDKNGFAFVAERDRERAIENLKKILEQGSMKIIEYVAVTKDGREFFAELSANVIKDPLGNPIGFVGITKDVTERKKAEEEIGNLAKFPSENPSPVLRIAKDGIILYANVATQSLLSELKTEIGQPAPPHWRRLVADALNSGLSKEIEVKHRDRLFLFTLTPVTETAYVNVYGLDITKRRKAEATLAESERRYRSLFANMNSGFAFCKIVSDNDGKPIDYVFLEVNDDFEKLTRLRKEAVLGKRVSEVLFSIEKDPTDWIGIYGRVATTGEPARFESYFELLKKWFSVAAYRPEIGYFAMAFDDITDRKKAEEALRESEEKHRSLIKLAPDGIIAVNTEGIVASANRSFLKLVGYDSEEGIVGKLFTELVTMRMEDIPKFQGMFKSLMKGESPSPSEFLYVRRDGTSRWAEVHPGLLTKDGNPVGVQAIMRDVTERKVAEEALRRSEEKWRSLAENAPNIIIVVDRLGAIQFINRTVVDARPEEIVGKSIYDFIDPEHHNVVKKTIKQVFQTGEGGSYEISGVGPKGSVSWYATQVGPIKQDGQIVSATLITTDVTERKNMEEQLKEYSEHLEEKVEERTNQLKKAQEQLLKAERLATIGQVATMVGHDLRNPLQVITNTIYTSEKKSESIPITEKEILEKHGFLDLRSGLKEQVEYMEKIVSDLQDYARPLKPMPVEIGLHQLIKKTLSSLTVPENVKVSIVVEKDFPKLMLDPTLMQRVFSNLITNAVQAMPNGGKLTIRASKKEETALINTEDTGEGISDENLSKLFTPLFTTKAKGQGFGLPVCKRMVEAHDGNITVESKVGKGSTFTVEIPLRKEVSYK